MNTLLYYGNVVLLYLKSIPNPSFRIERIEALCRKISLAQLAILAVFLRKDFVGRSITLGILQERVCDYATAVQRARALTGQQGECLFLVRESMHEALERTETNTNQIDREQFEEFEKTFRELQSLYKCHHALRKTRYGELFKILTLGLRAM